MVLTLCEFFFRRSLVQFIHQYKCLLICMSNLAKEKPKELEFSSHNRHSQEESSTDKENILIHTTTQNPKTDHKLITTTGKWFPKCLQTLLFDQEMAAENRRRTIRSLQCNKISTDESFWAKFGKTRNL